MKGLFSRLGLQLLHAPAACSADTTSAAADLKGYEGAVFAVAYGADATPPDGTTNYWHCKLTECDTIDGSYTDVADSDIENGTVPDNAFAFCQSASEDNKIYAIGYIGRMRFVKVELIEEGAVSLAGVTIIAILGHPHTAPPSGGITVSGS